MVSREPFAHRSNSHRALGLQGRVISSFGTHEERQDAIPHRKKKTTYMANQPIRVARKSAIEAPSLVNGIAIATTVNVAGPELKAWQDEEKGRVSAGIERSRSGSTAPVKPISFALAEKKQLPQSLTGSLEGAPKARLEVAQKTISYVADELKKLGVQGAEAAITADVANDVVGGQLRKADYDLQAYSNTKAFVALLGVEGQADAIAPVLFPVAKGDKGAQVLVEKNFKRTSLLERFSTVHKIPTPKNEAERTKFFSEAASALDAEITAASDKMVKLIEEHNGSKLSPKEAARVRMATAVTVGERYSYKSDSAAEASYEKNVLSKVKNGAELAKVFANRVGPKTLDDRRFQQLLQGVGFANPDSDKIVAFVKANPLEQVRGKDNAKSTKSNLVLAIEAAGLKPEQKSAAMTLARALELHRPVPVPGVERVKKALEAFPEVQKHIETPKVQKGLLLRAGYEASSGAVALHGRKAYQEAAIEAGIAKGTDVTNLTSQAQTAYTKALANVSKEGARGDKEANLEMYDNAHSKEAFVAEVVGKGISSMRWNEPTRNAVEQSSERGTAALEAVL